ncbi:MAG: fatty-acyl-CoA synthase, partial [Actinomycetota bacterium]|nr:fatty-acyl-CoA synthase [Actinomycetota bacterium]
TDALATPLPFFHVAGLDLALSTLSAAGTVVIPDGPDVPSTWAAVERHGATIVQTLGSYRKLLRKAPRDLHRLRGIYGNSRWDSELDQLPAEFSIWTGYGSTELCGFAVGHNRATLAASPGTIGRPMLGYAATVVDERDRPVARGAVGELLMRGPALTTGYWGLPDASADALRGGWLHTGDLVEVREDGTLRFADRLKDMVKPGGENVYCIEVEEALAACPGVLEVAVIGVPDPRWGEAVKAVVAVRPDVTVEQLDAWALERLAPYKRPRWYEFVDALPRNALSKVVKTDLRAAHDEHSSIRLPERS